MGTTGGAAALAAAALLTAGTLAGCGSDSSTVAQDPTESTPTVPSTSQTPGEDPTGPICARSGRRARSCRTSYRGCVTDAGWVKAEVYQCSDGHRLVTYAHAFYASPGRTISRAATTLAKDHGFQQTMAVCEA